MENKDINTIYQIGERVLCDFEKARMNPCKTQINFLKKLMEDNKDTEYGKQYHFKDIDSFESYKKKVPVSEYKDYETYIDRMIENRESNLISSRPIIHYATSSGSTGKPKRIPVSDVNVQGFSDYTASVFACLKRQIQLQSKKDGPWCVLTELRVKPFFDDVTIGSISALGDYHVEEFFNGNTTSPNFLQKPQETIPYALWLKALFALIEPDLSFIFATYASIVYEFMHMIEKEWMSLVNTIRYGQLDESIPFSLNEKERINFYLKADPQRADFLQKEFEKGFETPIVPRIWPNVAMICCVGGSFFSEYSRRLKKYCGNIPTHALAYAASESIIAIPMDYNSNEYEFYVNNVFLEFLEAGKEDFSQTVLIDELEDGKDYEIILSNVSGFYRYRMMDVIHIEGHKGNRPYGHIVYRLNQVVNMVGEKTNTEQLEYIKDHLATHIGVNITAYSVYADYSITPSRYILFFEPESNCGKGIQSQYNQYVDDLFRKVNVSYEKYRHQNALGQAVVMFVEPETYLLYKEVQIANGISVNQVKPVFLIDTENKINFFFGFAESPYKALKRNIFEMKRKIETLEELRIENQKLKEEIQQLLMKE